MERRRVVITGLGAVTPIGLTAMESWQAVKDGVCGIAPITQFDPTGMKVQVAAEVKGFDPAAFMPKSLARTMAPFMQYAFAAGEEALADSGLEIGREPDRVGIVMGTAMDGVTTVAETQAAYDAGHGEGGVYLPLDDPDFLENTFVMPMRLEFKVERPDGVSNSGWNNFVRNGLDDLTF